MGIFYTSDLHLGHHSLAVARGFDSATEHDDAIMGNLRKYTSPGDEVWVLGDLSIGSRAATDHALSLLSDFAATGRTLHLISGNHDATSPIHRNGHAHQADFFRVFDSVSHVARRKIGSHWVWLSHFPFHGQRDGGDEGRSHLDQSIRVHDDGVTALIHGHLHSPEPVTGPRSVDVGLEANRLRPWSGGELGVLLDRLRAEDEESEKS